MRVCLISVEIFAWGKYGGFGRDTRVIGRELVERGLEVTAVVPRRGEQKPVDKLDGMQVLGFTQRELLSSTELYQTADADIYHSMEPSLGTYLAQRAMPDRKHIVTFLDPRDSTDWLTELRLPSVNPTQVLSNWVYEDSWLVRRAVRRADGLFVAAYFLKPKAKAKYRLEVEPGVLPTPVTVPDTYTKAESPTVCFVARWDRRKRPEVFFEMVKAFPEVRFLAAGQSRDENWDQYLREKYGGLPNLEMLGFIDQFDGDKLWNIFSQSWILVNTAAREGLPNALKEAVAHGCAILSSVDPEGFASRFGYYAQQDDFVEGLRTLLQDDFWRKQGAEGRKYVLEEYSLDRAIDRHIEAYEQVIGDRN